jgi:hypothetical protein
MSASWLAGADDQIPAGRPSWVSLRLSRSQMCKSARVHTWACRSDIPQPRPPLPEFRRSWPTRRAEQRSLLSQILERYTTRGITRIGQTVVGGAAVVVLDLVGHGPELGLETVCIAGQPEGDV